MKVAVEISTPVHPTESESKVRKALESIFPCVQFSLDGTVFKGKSEELKSLEHIKELLESQRIRSTANKILRNSLFGRELIFCLNKQAAYMGKVNFSEDSPLGPITVTISCENVEALITYLSPRAPEM
ncbi:MAG: RNA-binding domain-containing protein [Candidatus Methanofastidiosia archaeon]